ncbi:MAG: tetratricopeptide repeat protein [Bacteroidales bacterium]|nr:tetratricopeptide repeat protein [Bacteroidales bacterium]
MIILAAGCSTQKNTLITRTYHNTTAKYNILFNGNESFNKGVDNLQRSFKDNYNTILPVFTYKDEVAVQQIFSDMDRTIKKCTKVVQMHSIKVKPETREDRELTPKQREYYNQQEFNKWVDDTYLLLGKAHFYKHEFGMAKETFMFMLSEFKNKPILYDVRLWLAKTFIETENYKNAEEILFSLNRDIGFPKRLESELSATIADYYLRQKKYDEAILPLSKAREKVKNKQQKIRYTFVLAQLNEKQGNLQKASDLYQSVVKMNPPYEMTFHAKINRALAYEKGSGSRKQIEDQLKKMLKDDKNIEYQDQIYFALGNIAYKENDEKSAIEQYKKSVTFSTTNTSQKAFTFLTLANIYYTFPDYVNAQAYYDSTVSLIDLDYPDYDIIYAKSISLNQLVTEINTVQLQDSVQLLAKMNTDDLNHYIDNLIQELNTQEAENRRLEQEAQQNQQYNMMMAQTGKNMAQDPTSQTKWYFYNPAAKNLGRIDFKAKWGNRRLEDNWRRSNKRFSAVGPGTTITENSELITTDEAQQAAASNTNNRTREFYLQNIPLTDSAMKASHNKIQDALFSMGVIYKTDLKDYDKAVVSFEELLQRYPETKYKLNTYYNLYSTFILLNNKGKLELYRNKIIREFPLSMYAKMMTNPDYIKELEAEQNIVNKYYEETYGYFQNQQYEKVIENCNEVFKKYPEDKLLPRFDYMRAISVGKTKDVRTFREALYELITKYPNSEVSENARIMIAYLDKDRPNIKDIEEIEIAEKLYNKAEDEEHYTLYIVPANLNLNQLLFNIINFNLDNFQKLNLTAVKKEFNNTQNVIIIKIFKNQNEAVDYYRKISADTGVLRDVDSKSISAFAISVSNYKIFLEDKSISRYQKFFEQNYIQ